MDLKMKSAVHLAEFLPEGILIETLRSAIEDWQNNPCEHTKATMRGGVMVVALKLGMDAQQQGAEKVIQEMEKVEVARKFFDTEPQ